MPARACCAAALGAVGWHPTGVVGGFGAAIAAGKLLRLDEERMCHAIGLAATQPVGVREMFGSMTKSFHPGSARRKMVCSPPSSRRKVTPVRFRASKQGAVGPEW